MNTKIKKIDHITLEIPKDLDAYHSQYKIKVTNNGNEKLEIKLSLKPFTNVNIKDSWYSIEPKSQEIQGHGHFVEFVLNLIEPPIITNSLEASEEVVTLVMITNPGETETGLNAYNLIIPPATPEKAAISLVLVAEEVKTMGLRLTQVETLLNQKQDVGEIQLLQTKIDKLETENASLKQQVRDYQRDIIQLEQTHSTQIETLKTAFQEQETKLNCLLEVDEKKRRLIEDLGNGITLELVEIPAGKFLMGGVREITLEPFLMGKYPVTQLQWFAIMGNNPSYFKGNNLPVEKVTWQEAKLFCEKLSALTGKKYQLPSESQWEYACCADRITNFFFGNDEKELDKYAWYLANSNNQTHPVGEKLLNPWGLYDILGNVWEWCQDDWQGQVGCHQEGYNHIPVDGSAWINNSATKCLRGGCFVGDKHFPSSYRDHEYATKRSYGYGFRVVMLLGAL